MDDRSVSLVQQLTQHTPHDGYQLRHDVQEFAELCGWIPSDHLEGYPGLETIANGHLVVEHGLDNTAVITFLRGAPPFSALAPTHQRSLLSISYNNLVDTHYFPDVHGLSYVSNRTYPFKPVRIPITDDPDCWRAEAYDRVTGRRPNPNIKRLDDALIATLSGWKRKLAAEMLEAGTKVSLEGISTLFNGVIFVRALEDHPRNRGRFSDPVLLSTWRSSGEGSGSVRECLVSSLTLLEAPGVPDSLLDLDVLRVFDGLDRQTVSDLFSDFYSDKNLPYTYDFSLMSKHALSRIYEKYVTLIRGDRAITATRGEMMTQKLLFRDAPEEVSDRALGGVYTPQYIARFFARYLKQNHTPAHFKMLRTCDPACGSGMFLRTILEMQCDPMQSRDIVAESKRAFENILGVDVDPNACQATRLSLALLHLVLTGRYPEQLRIENKESILFFNTHKELSGKFDAVIANPPFTKYDDMPEEWRSRVTSLLSEPEEGKPGLFLALLKLGLDTVKPGGFVLYVLPRTTLIAPGAARLRKEMAENFWVRMLADLHEIPVFEGIGSYVVLMILQRKVELISGEKDVPKAIVVRCSELVGQALQNALEGRVVNSDFYDIYEADQSQFAEPKWYVLTPGQNRLKERLRSLPSLEDFLDLRQGLITGADKVFVRSREEVQPTEAALYRAFLSDREMIRYVPPYSSPNETPRLVFYPFLGEQPIGEDDLQKFPETLAYLEKHGEVLRERSQVVSGSVPWWRPERPRPPERLLRPKIVSPHLVLLPRFSIDPTGQYAVSHCPVLLSKRGGGIELLRFFVAVLNSSVAFWQIANQAHKYRRGYNMLELNTLRHIKVPDPKDVPPATMSRLQHIVRDLLRRAQAPQDGPVPEPESSDYESELDEIVTGLYELSREERAAVGMGVR